MADIATLPIWAAQYIGIPFVDKGRDHSGADCWGILQLVLREQYKIDVPVYNHLEYGEGTKEIIKEIGEYIVGKAQGVDWVEITTRVKVDGRDKLEGLELILPGDVIVARLKAHPTHVAVVIAPGWMLHSMIGTNCMREEYETPLWEQRIIGVFRHVSRCN